MNVRAFVVLTSTLLAWSCPSFANDTANVTAAEQLFSDGRALMAQRKYDQACPKLEASQRLDPGAGTLLNLAGCYEAWGRTASAWATYREAESAAAQTKRSDWERVARDRAKALEPKLSYLTVTLSPEAQALGGLVVERDGKALDPAIFDTAVPIDPGTHVVKASAPGRREWSSEASIGANGTRSSVSIPALEALPAAVEATPPQETPRAPPKTSEGSGRRTLGLVALGVGAAGLAAGAVFGLVANGTYDDALANDCGGRTNGCTQAGIDNVSTARTQAAFSTGLFVGGGVVAAAGLALFFTAPKPSTSVAVSASPAGVFATGRF